MNKAFELALNCESDIRIYNTDKRVVKCSYPIAKTNIRPCDHYSVFSPIKERLNNYNINMMFLQSVVAVKYKTGVKDRNLFFLRNAKIKKNELSFDLYLSCVNNVQDLYKLDITNLFELKPHLNYFFTTNVKMSNFLEVLSDEFIQRICAYADRKQANFKMRSTY